MTNTTLLLVRCVAFRLDFLNKVTTIVRAKGLEVDGKLLEEIEELTSLIMALAAIAPGPNEE
jgi:hypothetical protein